MTYFCVFYLVFFSLIKHKEMRFLLPIVPFALVLAGEMVHTMVTKWNHKWRVNVFLKVWIVVELIWLYVET